MGKDATWRTIILAQQFVEILLAANTGSPVEKERSFLLVPGHVTYKLKNLHQQLKWRSAEVQGSAGFGLSFCLEYCRGFPLER